MDNAGSGGCFCSGLICSPGEVTQGMGAPRPPTPECPARSWASGPSPNPSAAAPVPGEPGNSSVAGRALSVPARPDTPSSCGKGQGRPGSTKERGERRVGQAGPGKERALPG